MLLITFETLRYERDCLRKAREAPLIHKAKTIGSLGIKKRNELDSMMMWRFDELGRVKGGGTGGGSGVW